MGYESLANDIRNGKKPEETAYYGRALSKEEEDHERAKQEYGEKLIAYEAVCNRLSEEIKQRQIILDEFGSSLQFGDAIGPALDKTRTELEAKTAELEKLGKEWKPVKAAWDKKENEWSEKRLDRSNKIETEWNEPQRKKFEAISKEIENLFTENDLDKALLITRPFSQEDKWATDPPSYEFLKNAQRALEQAVIRHFDPKDRPNFPDYMKIFADDPSFDFEKLLKTPPVTENKAENPQQPEKVEQPVIAKPKPKTPLEKNQEALKTIFSSGEPEKQPGFLDAIYNRLKYVMDMNAVNNMSDGDYSAGRFDDGFNPFFTDRGSDEKIPDDEKLLLRANQLVDLYELAKNADEFMAKLPKVSETAEKKEREKQEFEREEIIEYMKMLKSQKGFLHDELMRLEAFANPYAPGFNLSSTETIKALADLYAKSLDNQQQNKALNNENFKALCKNCYDRWMLRTDYEIEAAETLLKECEIREGADPFVKEEEIMLIIKDKNDENAQPTIVPYTRAEAKKAMLADKDVQIYFERPEPGSSEPEKVALRLENDGKMAWATYKVQIDCDCDSLDPKTLPKKPGMLSFIKNWFRKAFRLKGVPEVEEYNRAEAKLKEATRKAKEFLEKNKAAEEKDALFADESEKDEVDVEDLLKKEEEERKAWEKLVAEEKKNREVFEYIRTHSEIGRGHAIWEAMSEDERKKVEAECEEYDRQKEIWDSAKESDRQKSRVTTLRSSKMLEKRAARKAKLNAAKREKTKKDVQIEAQKYTTELFKSSKAFYAFSDESRFILMGKTGSGIDLTKLTASDLKNAANNINETLKQYMKGDEWDTQADFADIGRKVVEAVKIDKLGEGRDYFKAESQLEKFDGLCNQEGRAKDADKEKKMLAIKEKRMASLAKVILLHAKERAKELIEMIPEAEKRDFANALEANEVEYSNVKSAVFTVINDWIRESIRSGKETKESCDECVNMAYGLKGKKIIDGQEVKLKPEEIKSAQTIIAEFSSRSGMREEELKSKVLQELHSGRPVDYLRNMARKHPELKSNPRYQDMFVDPFKRLDELKKIEDAKNAEKNAEKNARKQNSFGM